MPESEALFPPQEPVATGLRARCPRCGKGRLFDGFLRVAPRCSACGLAFSFADSADGPAVFAILIVGFVVAGAALLTEVAYTPPLWLHFVLWLPLALAAMRLLKGVLIALQHHHQAREGRLSEKRPAAHAKKAP